jgi:DNA polymerase-3 subunit delta'
MNLFDSLNQLYYKNQLPYVSLINTNNTQIALEELAGFVKKAFNITLTKYNSNSLLLQPEDSGNINIDQVRKLKSLLHQTSTDGPKVAAIYQADCMNINSANAALKLLEEPTSNTYIFLITAKLRSILATIRSRCYKLKCDYTQNQQLAQYHELVALLLQNDTVLILEKLDFKAHWESFADSCLLLINKMIKFKLDCYLNITREEKFLFGQINSNSSIMKLIACYDEIYFLTAKAVNHDLELKSIAILLLESVYEHIGNRN